MHIALVQSDIVWQDKPANHARIEAMLDAAAVPAGALVVLPELGDTGFSFDLDAIVDGRTIPWATGLARSRGVWVQVGYATRDGDGLGRNCATIIAPDGEVRGTYRKFHPFSYGGEARHYGGGDRLLVDDVDSARVAPMICYDLRFPELWRHATLAGAELFAIGANWPDARQSHWRALLIARAIENLAFVAAVNRVGSDPHLGYAGGSIVVSPTGEVLAEAGDGQEVLQASIDLDALRAWRGEFPALDDVRRSLLGAVDIDSR